MYNGAKKMTNEFSNQINQEDQSMATPEKKESKKTSNGKSKQIKATLSATDANFLKEIAEKLGISEQDVIRKGVKLMNLYSSVYDQPDAKMVLETADTKQDILIL